MKLQILSDLHLETERFQCTPAPGADLLVLAGDIDGTWRQLSQFQDWPVPVLFVPGNHEFDRRDVDDALAGLRERCGTLGLRMLERDEWVMTAPDGRRIRFLGTTRWSDFDLFGEALRAKVKRAASYYVKVMKSTRDGGKLFDADGVREEALVCRAWLQDALRRSPDPTRPDEGWDATVAITHYGPSLRSADPRYGDQPGTASFCNADDDLIPLADLWIHGHLHCRHDYLVPRPTSGAEPSATRVVSNARGHSFKEEPLGWNPHFCVSI